MFVPTKSYIVVPTKIFDLHAVPHYNAPAPRVGALSDDARLTSVCAVHRPTCTSRTERPVD